VSLIWPSLLGQKPISKWSWLAWEQHTLEAVVVEWINYTSAKNRPLRQLSPTFCHFLSLDSAKAWGYSLLCIHGFSFFFCLLPGCLCLISRLPSLTDTLVIVKLVFLSFLLCVSVPFVSPSSAFNSHYPPKRLPRDHCWCVCVRWWSATFTISAMSTVCVPRVRHSNWDRNLYPLCSSKARIYSQWRWGVDILIN